MRVLVVTPSLPLPFGTADARWLFVVVSEMARRGHDVTCLACTEETAERVASAAQLAARHDIAFEHVPLELRETALTRKVRSLRRPFSEYARVEPLRRRLRELAEAADIVHIEHLFPSWLAGGIENSVTYLHHLEIIDWEHRTDLSSRDRRTRWQMQRATQSILQRAGRVMTATSRLEARANELAPASATAIVPVSIDTDRYAVLPTPDEPVVGIIGSMHWYPSRSAAEKVLTTLWPRIRERVPDARLLVGGWGSQKHLGHLFPSAGAELVGEVDRPEDFFERISVLLYPPVRGSGFKIKVLEAMAYGRVVVSNSDGFEGLTDRPQQVADPADTDELLIAGTAHLLADPTRRERLAKQGRQLVESVYSPVPAVDRLESAYQHLGLHTPARR